MYVMYNVYDILPTTHSIFAKIFQEHNIMLTHEVPSVEEQVYHKERSAQMKAG